MLFRIWVTLPSVKTTYTERSKPDEDTAEKGCNQGEEKGLDLGLSGGVSVVDSLFDIVSSGLGQ